MTPVFASAGGPFLFALGIEDVPAEAIEGNGILREEQRRARERLEPGVGRSGAAVVASDERVADVQHHLLPLGRDVATSAS
jgi:hypothetical protein